jgi:hypothetical protein
MAAIDFASRRHSMVQHARSPPGPAIFASGAASLPLSRDRLRACAARDNQASWALRICITAARKSDSICNFACNAQRWKQWEIARRRRTCVILAQRRPWFVSCSVVRI